MKVPKLIDIKDAGKRKISVGNINLVVIVSDPEVDPRD